MAIAIVPASVAVGSENFTRSRATATLAVPVAISIPVRVMAVAVALAIKRNEIGIHRHGYARDAWLGLEFEGFLARLANDLRERRECLSDDLVHVIIFVSREAADEVDARRRFG